VRLGSRQVRPARREYSDLEVLPHNCYWAGGLGEIDALQDTTRRGSFQGRQHDTEHQILARWILRSDSIPIKWLDQRHTVIAVSHQLDMIMDFGRVVIMETGEIEEVGIRRHW